MGLDMERRIALLCLVFVLASPSRGVETGDVAPECVLKPLRDASPDEIARLRGHVVWIDFWASWCAPCAEAFPFLDALDRDFRDRGLRILAIDLDEDPADVAAFLERHQVSFALAADPTGECPRRFGVEGMPSSYLVDRKGVVRHVQRGFQAGEAEELRRRVEELLAEPAEARVPANENGRRSAGD
jgi:thiol-disulfide isomerase/thioredoxin